jgi:endonuclease III related protein
MNARRLTGIYNKLHAAFGPRNWWPARTPEEVMFGAILTQNAAWSNVVQALQALKSQRLLSFRRIADADEQELALLVRPARYFNQKARALKEFAAYFGTRYNFSLSRMRRRDTLDLRDELLGVYRIGPETADSILLYALEKPIFVIDAYTKRILSRHGILSMQHSYDDFQQLFMKHLPPDTALYNDFHAQLVHLGNLYCKPKPLCGECPLSPPVMGSSELGVLSQE